MKYRTNNPPSLEAAAELFANLLFEHVSYQKREQKEKEIEKEKPLPSVSKKV